MNKFVIEKTIFINVLPTTVFNALTNSEKIIQYYPLKEVKSNWKVGDEIIFKGSNQNRDFIDYGKIDILIPNQQFQYTYWSDNHGTDKTPENYLTISYSLKKINNGTNLNIKHGDFKSEEMYSQMLSVWDFLLKSLKNFVER